MPFHHVSVRVAHPDDADGVWLLARDLATTYTPLRASFDAVWPVLASDLTSVVLVALCDQCGVIGYVLGSTHLTFMANGPVALVEEVMVDDRHRRLGVGRLLMDAVEGWSREHRAAYVSLATRRAGAFYRDLNYEESAAYCRKLLEV